MVGAALLVDLVSKNVLVAKHVPDFRFFDWHALLVSELQSAQLVTVIVLGLVVGALGKLCELLFASVAAHLTQRARLGGFGLEHVNQGPLFTLVKPGKQRHELFELFLGSLESLMARLHVQVHLFEHELELVGAGVHGLKNLGVNELLVVELSDLLLRVDLSEGVALVVKTVSLAEEVILKLAVLGLGVLHALHHIKGQGEQLFTIGDSQIELVDFLFVILKRLNEVLDVLLIGDGPVNGLFDVVEGNLKSDRVVRDSVELFLRQESHVLEPVDLAVHPVHVVRVFAETFDLHF